MLKICVATIVSANYLAYARVLEKSLSKNQPEATFKVLLVERYTKETARAAAHSGLDITFAGELGLLDIENLAFKYDLVELNTALKPTFLKNLFNDGFDQVIYLDPDIFVFNSLAPVVTQLAVHQVVLTPHALQPVMDGFRPSDIDFLRNGSFNLGFIGLARGEECSSFLDWWEARCLSYGFNDLAFGTFVDQKWIDLVPSYFSSVHILKNRSCNVAYWNLHERSVSRSDDTGQYMVGLEPLCFFHFSGVKADRPNQLSRHQTRHHITPGSLLANLVEEYCASLVRMDHGLYSKINYTFGYFEDGSAITPVMRRSSCFLDTSLSPFSAEGSLYNHFKSLGWLKQCESQDLMAFNTLSFDENDRRVVFVNLLFRSLARLIGVDRLMAFLKYCAFLMRDSNFARMLHKAHFMLDQPADRRKVN